MAAEKSDMLAVRIDDLAEVLMTDAMAQENREQDPNLRLKIFGALVTWIKVKNQLKDDDNTPNELEKYENAIAKSGNTVTNSAGRTRAAPSADDEGSAITALIRNLPASDDGSSGRRHGAGGASQPDGLTRRSVLPDHAGI